MKIHLLVVGKVSSEVLPLVNNYVKMLQKYATVEISEIKEEVVRGKESPKLITEALDNEGEKMLKRLNERDFVVVLTPEGDDMTSEIFSVELANAFAMGQSKVTFIIGGSHGISNKVKARANMKISFSKFTFPHQLFRVMLLEQIFRAFKIKNNEVYHK